MKFVQPPEHPRVNVLIVGPPKSGKSAGAGTAPGGVLYLNADLPNATRYVHKHNPEGRIMEVEIPPYVEGQHPVENLMVEISNTVADPKQTIVESVVVDPVGELYRRYIEELSKRSVSPSLNHHLTTGVQIERFCRFLCTAPVNAIFVTHELPVKNESTGEVWSLPFTGTQNPSLGQKLMGMVDVLAYAGVVEQEDGKKAYMAQLITAKGRHGGDRFSCLGDMRTMDLAEWVKVIEDSELAEELPLEKERKAA